MTSRPGPLLTPEQAAAELNISATTLRRLRHQGRGPRWIGFGPRTVRYSPIALDDWRAAQAVNQRKCGSNRA